MSVCRSRSVCLMYYSRRRRIFIAIAVGSFVQYGGFRRSCIFRSILFLLFFFVPINIILQCNKSRKKAVHKCNSSFRVVGYIHFLSSIILYHMLVGSRIYWRLDDEWSVVTYLLKGRRDWNKFINNDQQCWVKDVNFQIGEQFIPNFLKW